MTHPLLRRVSLIAPCIAVLVSAPVAPSAHGFDYEGHYAINQLALASLPADFPQFTLTAERRERIAFLAGEPDRWRNVPDLPLRHVNAPDHYIDLEELKLYDLSPDRLPLFRYDFVADIARARLAHPDRFPSIDPFLDKDHTRELTGFLPWTIEEYADKLKSCFSYWKALVEAGGTPAEIANAEENVAYVMGVMGHFVGDGAQPLHTTIHFNGWVGPNPRGFTTNRSFHAWIDGGYFRKTGGVNTQALLTRIRPANRLCDSTQSEGTFRATIKYLLDSNALVEPLYQLEKDGKLSGQPGTGPDGRTFLDNRLVAAGQMLGDLWYTSWLNAPEDVYLKRHLHDRKPEHTATGNQ